MAEGGEMPSALSQPETVVPSSEMPLELEPLQGLQPAKAPGASNPDIDNNRSRLGIFRVLAGITPGTSAAVNTQLPSSSAGLISLHSPFTQAAGSSGQVEKQSVRDNLISPLPGYGEWVSCNPRSNMAAPSQHASISRDPKYASATVMGEGMVSCDPRSSVTDPSHNIMTMLIEQCKQNRHMFQEQQKAIEQLNQTVSGFLNRPASISTADSEEVWSYFDVVSSEGENSEDDYEPEVKRQKQLPGVSTGEENNKIKKLRKIESQLSNQETFGPDVHEVVASAVNKGLAETLDHKSTMIQDLLSKYNRPENCTFLDVPKVNKLLWSNRNTSKDLKQTDKGLQRTQTYMTKGMIPLVQLMNKTLLMESEEADELFDLSFNMLAYAHRDVSSHRRMLLKPAISSRYASLCNDAEMTASPTNLFGDDKDLEKRMKEVDDSQKMGKSLTYVQSNRPRQPARPTGRLAPRDQTTGRPFPASTRDFLGKRALAHRPVNPHHKMGAIRRTQGPKATQSYHKK